MARKKVIKVNETTSIEVPARQLTWRELFDIQIERQRVSAEAMRKMAEAHLQQAIAMGKLIDLFIAQYEAQNPQLKMGRLITNQRDTKHLN
jgi:phage FluMu protein gp41